MVRFIVALKGPLPTGVLIFCTTYDAPLTQPTYYGGVPVVPVPVRSLVPIPVRVMGNC